MVTKPCGALHVGRCLSRVSDDAGQSADVCVEAFPSNNKVNAFHFFLFMSYGVRVGVGVILV